MKNILILAGLVVGSNFLIWLPHLLQLPNFFGLNFSRGFQTIYLNFDGLEYVFIAKSFYQPSIFAQLPQSLPASYYPSHFPGFALLILVFAPLLGYLKAMLLASLLATIASTVAFYFLVRDFKLTNHPLLLSSIFIILPARWLIVHSVGSSEPLFIFLIISCLYFVMKYLQTETFKHLVFAGLFGFLAQFTRPPGALLFISLALFVLWQNYKLLQTEGYKSFITAHLRYYPLLFMPLALLVVFLWYFLSLGDFWAYFHSGDNIHLSFPPYQVFNKSQYWVGDIWLEDILYIFGVGFLGAVMLYKKRLFPLAFFVFTYLTASTLVAHRDISRYVLPIYPFLLIAFEKVLTSQEFRIVLAIIGLAIYLYSQNFILANTAPFPNVELFN